MGRRKLEASETAPRPYLGSDDKWHARVTMGFRPDGSKVRRHVKRSSKSEVVRAIRELERTRDAAGFSLTVENPTLATWVDHWLDAIVPVACKPKTVATYRSQMRKHVLPVLGGVRLDRLTPEMLDHLYADLIAAGCSAHTTNAVHRVVRSALSEAERRRRIASNPAKIARGVRVEEREVEPLTVDEARSVTQAATRRRQGVRWSLALSLGLRQGEALGLEWKQIDLQTGSLRVVRSLQRINWQHGCRDANLETRCRRTRGADCPERHSGGLVLSQLKTRASRRVLPIPEPLVRELESHMASQRAERTKAGEKWVANDLVFCGPVGHPVDPKDDGRDWHDLLRQAGVRRVRVHDARHTAATILLLKGVDERTVMDLMGWTEQRTARRYMHVVSEMKQAAAAVMGSALWEPARAQVASREDGSISAAPEPS